MQTNSVYDEYPINGSFSFKGPSKYVGLKVGGSNVNVVGTWTSCSREEFPDRGNTQSTDKDCPIIQALACAHVLNLLDTHGKSIFAIVICRYCQI